MFNRAKVSAIKNSSSREKKFSATNCRESFYLRHAGGFMAFNHLTSRTGRAENVARAHDVTSGRMFMAFLLAEIKQ